MATEWVEPGTCVYDLRGVTWWGGDEALKRKLVAVARLRLWRADWRQIKDEWNIDVLYAEDGRLAKIADDAETATPAAICLIVSATKF